MNPLQIEIRTADGISDGYLYLPDGEGSFPGVIHLTDIGGIRPVQHDMAQRLAGEGYCVLMPNVFYRTGRPPVFPDGANMSNELGRQRYADITAPLTPEAIERDVSAYLDFLADQDAVSATAMGVVGYCFTGALALRTAARRPDRIGAAASFHGARLFTDAPTSPHLLLPRIHAHLYFGHAVEDRGMSQEAIDGLGQALAAWGGSYESEVYPGAYHGWTVPDSPVYNPEQAEHAYQKLKELFAGSL